MISLQEFLYHFSWILMFWSVWSIACADDFDRDRQSDRDGRDRYGDRWVFTTIKLAVILVVKKASVSQFNSWIVLLLHIYWSIYDFSCSTVLSLNGCEVVVKTDDELICQSKHVIDLPLLLDILLFINYFHSMHSSKVIYSPVIIP